MHKTGDLTSPQYWARRQSLLNLEPIEQPLRDLIDAITPYLRPYICGRFLEIGCSPGRVMSFLRQRLEFEAHGIDYSPEAWQFLDNLRRIAGVSGSLFNVDVRQYDGPRNFDVVASFGLVEHFQDPDEIVYQHQRLCRSGGLIVITVPNFRYFQWLYHRIFDRLDLSRHNTLVMELEYFRNQGRKYDHQILFLGYVGRISFWGVDESAPSLLRALRKYSAVAVQIVTANILAHVLPSNIRYYSPWIVYVARKP